MHSRPHGWNKEVIKLLAEQDGPRTAANQLNNVACSDVARLVRFSTWSVFLCGELDHLFGLLCSVYGLLAAYAGL
jgi:hypothetical protein